MSEIILADTVTKESVKDRLEGSFKVLIEQSDIPPLLTSTVENFFTIFINTTDEAQLIDLLKQLTEELIPYILEGDE